MWQFSSPLVLVPGLVFCPVVLIHVMKVIAGADEVRKKER
jgi:hypothetical protein